MRHAHDACLGDRRMLDERALDLGRNDAETAELDEVLQPIDDREVAGVVEAAEVAGPQPPAGQKRRRDRSGPGAGRRLTCGDHAVRALLPDR